MCSVRCVCEYFQLCRSVTTQIVLGRNGVVYLNSGLGFGSVELKLRVCINSVVLGWQNLSYYAQNICSPRRKGRAWERTERQWVNSWLHIWYQQESGTDSYGTHSGLRPARNRWDTSDKVESLPNWRVVTDGYKFRNKAGKRKRGIIVYGKEPFGCMELLCGRHGLSFFLHCEVENITTLCTPSCHFSAFWGKVE